jgi:hypothetical protein
MEQTNEESPKPSKGPDVAGEENLRLMQECRKLRDDNWRLRTYAIAGVLMFIIICLVDFFILVEFVR